MRVWRERCRAWRGAGLLGVTLVARPAVTLDTLALIRAGTFLVQADQPGARLLFTVAEPWSTFGRNGSPAVPVYRLERIPEGLKRR